MSEINMNKVVGDKFEDMSITEMMLVQGSGDVSGEFTTSPACVALSFFSSVKCAGAVSAIGSAISGAVVSIVKC